MAGASAGSAHQWRIGESNQSKETNESERKENIWRK
jgi:hypothetical protein